MEPRRISPPLSAAKLLIRDKATVLKNWEQAVRLEVPAAEHESSSALRDSLPEVIDEIIRTLAAESPMDVLKKVERGTGPATRPRTRCNSFVHFGPDALGVPCASPRPV